MTETEIFLAAGILIMLHASLTSRNNPGIALVSAGVFMIALAIYGMEI